MWHEYKHVEVCAQVLTRVGQQAQCPVGNIVSKLKRVLVLPLQEHWKFFNARPGACVPTAGVECL